MRGLVKIIVIATIAMVAGYLVRHFQSVIVDAAKSMKDKVMPAKDGKVELKP